MLLSPLLIVTVFAVGVLVGGVGIGGVLLLPALNYMGDIPVHTAIPVCVFSYIATGAVGVAIYSRHGTVNWVLAVKLCLGGLPGAYLGAFLLPHFSAVVLEFGIAACSWRAVCMRYCRTRRGMEVRRNRGAHP